MPLFGWEYHPDVFVLLTFTLLLCLDGSVILPVICVIPEDDLHILLLLFGLLDFFLLFLLLLLLAFLFVFFFLILTFLWFLY